METRGRKMNLEMALKVKELSQKGLSNNDIADMVGISNPMVRYYLRLEDSIIQNSQQQARKSLTQCFFSQPREIQEQIADMIGYILPKENNSDYSNIYSSLSNVKLEKSELVKKVRKFLNGEIERNNIEQEFSYDERIKLSACKEFVAKTNEIFAGVKCDYTNEEILNKVKEL